jgi:GMP synthase (glutamine-hydrolysing)
MQILIIDNGSKNLTPLFSALQSHTLEIISFTDFDFSPPDTTSADLILLPGASQYGINDNQTLFTKESYFIRNTELPILGICFGAELIAHAYGSTLTQLPDKVDGIREISVINPDHPLFLNQPLLQVRESHYCAITAVHEPLLPLAVSETGVEIFEHSVKRHLGMQFHPESPQHTADGSWLLERVIDYLTLK